MEGLQMFPNATRLSRQIAITIPSTVDVDKETDTSTWVDEALALLSRLFGGATAMEGLGGWLSSTVGLVKEKIVKVYAYADDLPNEKIAEVYQFVTRMRHELRQEAIAVEVDGEMYLVW